METKQTDEQGRPLTYWGGLADEAFEKESKINNVHKLIDKDIFDQAILAMEEHYGYRCETEIDAYFRGAKWMYEQLNK